MKERNRLATAYYEHRRQAPGYGNSEMKERDETVQKTMKAILDTLAERNAAYEEAYKLAKHDPTIDLSRSEHQYQEPSYDTEVCMRPKFSIKYAKYCRICTKKRIAWTIQLAWYQKWRRKDSLQRQSQYLYRNPRPYSYLRPSLRESNPSKQTRCDAQGEILGQGRNRNGGNITVCRRWSYSLRLRA